MRSLIVPCAVAFSFFLSSIGADRKPLAEIPIDDFVTDTQVQPKGAGDDHVAIVWWIPQEYWEAVFARDTTTPEAGKKAVLGALSKYSLVGIVQSDISQLGAFNFYSQEEVKKGIPIEQISPSGEKEKLTPIEKIDPDLKILLDTIKPILTNAMGNMGSNFHFYILDRFDENGAKIVDPYSEGSLKVDLKRRDGVVLTSAIEMPLNSLFIPRLCPNGKPAHVSWKFCPWTGKPLQ